MTYGIEIQICDEHGSTIIHEQLQAFVHVEHAEEHTVERFAFAAVTVTGSGWLSCNRFPLSPDVPAVAKQLEPNV